MRLATVSTQGRPMERKFRYSSVLSNRKRRHPHNPCHLTRFDAQCKHGVFPGCSQCVPRVFPVRPNIKRGFGMFSTIDTAKAVPERMGRGEETIRSMAIIDHHPSTSKSWNHNEGEGKGEKKRKKKCGFSDWHDQHRKKEGRFEKNFSFPQTNFDERFLKKKRQRIHWKQAITKGPWGKGHDQRAMTKGPWPEGHEERAMRRGPWPEGHNQRAMRRGPWPKGHEERAMRRYRMDGGLRREFLVFIPVLFAAGRGFWRDPSVSAGPAVLALQSMTL